MVLNAFAHAAGIEVGAFFNDSDPQGGENTGEYTGEFSALTFSKTPPAPAGNVDGKVTRFRRTPDSPESSNDLPKATGSSPRRSTSVPSTNLDENHASLFGNFSRQIIPLSIRYTPALGTNFRSPSLG